MKNLILNIFLLAAIVPISLRAQFYVSPTGNDNNPGTIALPFRTLTKAVSVSDADSLIFMRGGTYTSSATITINKNGAVNRYLKVWGYPGETPVLDFSSQTSSIDGIKLAGSFVHFKRLEIIGAGHNGINISGHYNIIEHCSIHDNRNSGLQMGSSSSTANPGNNLILNCDAFRNYDAPIGGNADGFAVKWNIGDDNAFVGCRAYNNSDDGWDLWMATATVTIDSCMAFRNGVDIWHSGSFDGNGNGFKLGGNNIATPNTVRNCVAFDNAGNTGRGFDENNNLAGQTVYNCTSFRNQGDNYHFNNSVVVGQHFIKNCISYQGNVSITSGTRQNNSWQGFTVSSADFRSLDTTLALAPRNTDGSLPANAFMRLWSGSALIDAGQNVGLPFNGPAPDLGAFEFSNAPVPVQLASFTAHSVPGLPSSVALHWRTISETNNYGFFVQRRAESGEQFVEVPNSFVAGHGTTNEPQQYLFNDNAPVSGTWHYRLKQVDLDGSVHYTDAIQVNVLTSVRESVPATFALEQNYPNPFNPTTTIRFQIPVEDPTRREVRGQNSSRFGGTSAYTCVSADRSAGWNPPQEVNRVTLKVFDLLGREVATLVDGVQHAGFKSVAFNAEALASGVYFYRLESGNKSDMKRLMVLK